MRQSSHTLVLDPIHKTRVRRIKGVDAYIGTEFPLTRMTNRGILISDNVDARVLSTRSTNYIRASTYSEALGYLNAIPHRGWWLDS